jgi:hypothetical protein
MSLARCGDPRSPRLFQHKSGGVDLGLGRVVFLFVRIKLALVSVASYLLGLELSLNSIFGDWEMKHRKWLMVMLVLALGITAVAGRGDDRKQDPKKPNDSAGKELRELMNLKLENSQKVLEAIATNDFEKIGKHAEALISISKRIEWRVLDTPDYDAYSAGFRRNAMDLVQKAKDKNLDGAALAYVDLTLTCVKCHKYVREARRVRLELAEPREVAHSDR